MASIELQSGYAMPLLGLGTWQLHDSQCAEVVERALDMGYRHIDTAHMYGNQEAVGSGFRRSRLNRGEVFITTKIWRDSLGYDQVLRQFQQCLDMLQLEYVDLLLIHWPNDAVPLEETLGAFEQLHAAGQVRSIGVSNFSNEEVDQAQQLARVPICVNQLEFHVGEFQEAVWRHCCERQVALTAHRPLGIGKLADDATLAAIGMVHGKSAAQVALRWLVQRQIVAIPKASSVAHLQANKDIFSWALDEEQMQRLDRL